MSLTLSSWAPPWTHILKRWLCDVERSGSCWSILNEDAMKAVIFGHKLIGLSHIPISQERQPDWWLFINTELAIFQNEILGWCRIQKGWGPWNKGRFEENWYVRYFSVKLEARYVKTLFNKKKSGMEVKGLQSSASGPENVHASFQLMTKCVLKQERPF